MAGYNEIKGLRVKYLSADPSNAENGQVWYNSTSGNLRVQGIGTSAWISGSPATNSPRIFSAGDGPVTAGWMAGGGSASPNDIASTEEYNGSGWSAGGDLPGATYGAAGVGPQTASLIFGGNNGSILATAYEYNGTAWGSPTSMPTGRNYVNRAGTQTSALAFGGSNPGPTSNVATSEYDGSSWTAGGNLPVGIEYAAGTGTQTAALAAGGYHQPGGTTEPTATLYYDGSAWTSAGTLPAGRWNTQGFGTQTDAVVAGGQPAPAGHDTGGIRWNGSSWAADASLANARNGATAMGQNSGPTSSGWVCGGPGVLTEEYNFSSNTFTAAAWASGGAYPTNIYGAAGAGDTPAGLLFGGYNGSAGLTTTSEYDGSSWTGGGALPVGKRYLAGFGTQTAALAAKGKAPPGPAVATSEEYNGSSWTAGGTASEAKMSVAGSGTQTSGLVFGGNPSASNSTEEYDGSSWTTGGNLGTGRANHSGSVGGTQTAALTFFGQDGSTPLTLNTEEYNGTSWSEQNNVPAGRFAAGGGGTQTAGYGFGGYLGSGVPNQTTSTMTCRCCNRCLSCKFFCCICSRKITYCKYTSWCSSCRA